MNGRKARIVATVCTVIGLCLAPNAAAAERPSKADCSASPASRATIIGPSSSYIEVAIRDNGEFTMGVPAGPILLYGHPSPWSSYTTIRVDGTDYHNYDGAFFGETLSPPTNVNSSNEGTWRVGQTPLQVKQTVTLVTGSATGHQDTYLIQYQVRNQDSASHVVGCRILFDTDLAGNDGAPFQVPGTGPVTTEMEFSGGAIPTYFFVVNDLNDPQVTCQGTLLGGQISPAPDKFQIADWGSIVDVAFDYAVQPSVSFDDSAYAAYWMNRTLAPGQSVTFSTYYGLGGVGVDPTPPLVTALSAPQFLECVENALTPNPFQVSLILSNTLPDGAPLVTGISATLTLPQGLAPVDSPLTQTSPDLAQGASHLLSWTIRADAEHPGTHPYSILVNSENAGSKTVPGSIAVPGNCGGPSGVLSGDVGIFGAQEFFLFNTSSVSGEAVLETSGGAEVARAPIQFGTFSFGPVPNGTYRLRAEVQYDDRVTGDALFVDYGCPPPGTLRKTATSRPLSVVIQGGPVTARVTFPPALVFLHGAVRCYGYWYDADATTAMWDNSARASGFISFTPNYTWWGPSFSWSGAADQVAAQVLQDLQGIHLPPVVRTGYGIPPWTVVGHDMGGLVARVLASGSHRDDPFMTRLAAVYLVGTPNSGSDMLLGAGEDSPLSANNLLRRFNETYPDFGSKAGLVTAVAGDKGWWGTNTADGPVSLQSALNITRLACSQGGQNATCTPYAHHAFRGNNSEIFRYAHFELGAPASESAVLQGLILSGPWTGRTADPESPAGGTMWGTGARTTGTTQGTAQGRSASADFAFPIGATDGMALGAWLTSGSATFQVLDPSGNPAGRSEREFTADAEGFLFWRANPVAGNWTLRVTPGGGGASFTATAVENSPFGISGYIARPIYYGGDTAALRLNREGSFQGVVAGTATATLFGPGGTLLQTVNLTPAGQHFDGSMTVPGTAGNYSVTFRLDGTYLGQPFTRTAYEALTVLPASRSRLFTGTFEDAGRDRDGDGKFDAIRLTAQVQLPAAGAYSFSGDLYDASGWWVSRASGSLSAQSAGTYSAEVLFPTDGITCSQFTGPLQVRNLTAADGGTLLPADLWAPPVPTQAYAADAFSCGAGTPKPTLQAVLPDEGIRGMAYDLVLSGTNLPQEPQISLGSGVTVLTVTPLAEGVLSVPVTILPDAAPGPRDITLTLPEIGTVVLPGAFEVKAASSPAVAIAAPAPGATVKGTILVTVSAWGDLPVGKVDFFVDGAAHGTDPEFPYQFPLDTTTLTEGSHTLTAVSTDASSNTATSAPLQVTVKNFNIPGDCDGDGSVSIGEVQKSINMFLGVTPPDCGVDCNGDGSVSIGEVQKVINNFLGIPSTC